MEPVINAHNKEEYPPMHTAEHILNQYMVRNFGCPRSRNAHIEKKKSKCDYILTTAPTQDQISKIEADINAIIAQNLPVTIEFMSQQEAAGIVDLSKLPEDATQTLRIVKVGDYDVCACAGAHVNNTLEIGTFKIISSDFEETSPDQGRWRVRWKVESAKA